jgi:hypothetical protein
MHELPSSAAPHLDRLHVRVSACPVTEPSQESWRVVQLSWPDGGLQGERSVEGPWPEVSVTL